MTAEPGEPLPGLSEEELGRFRAGQAIFTREFTPEAGLGPLFNDNSCFSCHDTPTSGGGGADPVTLASRWDPETERCELPSPVGAVVQQRLVPELAARFQEDGLEYRAVPEWATASVEMLGPPLYGLGLVDAIPEEAILARAGDSSPGDGSIRGRPARAPDDRLGRFGRKGGHADLRSFTAGALLAEMGITTPVHPEKLPIPHDSVQVGVHGAPDLDDRELDLLVDYLRLLAAPPPLTPEDPRERAAVERGRRLFGEVGCADCHVPEMTTGPSEIGALDRVRVPLHSDLLLHDLGPELSGICSPGVRPSEWRTAILMGLRFRSELLHDGRAGRLEQAIGYHGGDAALARAGFEALDPSDREALLAYLRTL